jgi:hypothetical protein
MGIGAGVAAAATVASTAASAGAGAAQSAEQTAVMKSQMRSTERIHEQGAADREKYSQMTQAEQGIARQNLLASEQARLNVMGSLGTSGTYGDPGSYGGPISLGTLKPTGLSGLNRRSGDVFSAGGTTTRSGTVSGEDVKLGKKARWKGERPWEVTGVNLDPDAMASAVEGTAGFRTVSRMVAEAEQLMNREGPLWDELNNSIVGGIYESNAAFQRQAMEQVSRAMARGGSARRVGLQMAQAFQVQEKINRQRTGQLWQAKQGLEQWRTQYAQQVTSYSQSWVSNQAGIRDSFTNALQNLQLYWSSTMAPTLASASVGAQEATQRGISNASQGLYDAAGVRGQAITGAVGGMIESVKSVDWGSIGNPGVAPGRPAAASGYSLSGGGAAVGVNP